MMPAVKKLLLCEDHAYFRKSLSSFILEERAAEIVVEAANGGRALEMFDSQRPGMVVMDVQMPVVTGIAAARQMKGLRPDVPIILYSMYPSGYYGTSLGIADYFLQKDQLFDDLIPAMIVLTATRDLS